MCGKHQSIGLALEERHAESRFKHLHHATYGSRRYIHFSRCGSKTAAARRHFESPNSVQMRESAHRDHQQNLC
jgi:hypothetical protein